MFTDKFVNLDLLVSLYGKIRSYIDSKLNLVQTTGDLEDKIMSLKAVTSALDTKFNTSNVLELSTGGSFDIDLNVMDNDHVLSASATQALALETLQTAINASINKSTDILQVTGQATDKVMSQKIVTDTLNDKVDKVYGKQLSTNDYTTADKNKLNAILSYTIGEGLTVENGVLKCSFTPTRYYTGSSTPINTLGNNGDLYLQISQ